MTVAALIDRLQGVQGRGPRWRAICPAHESKHSTRSLSIFEADDGRLLLHCFAGCDVGSIVAAVGLDLSDLFPPRTDQLPAHEGHFARPVRKPWRVRDLIAALRHELTVAFVALAAVRAGTPPNNDDADRAGLAMDRIAALLDELEHAH